MNDALERIARRWTVQVLGALRDAGTLRYTEVQRAVHDIPQRMLTLALRDLERAGLVERTRYPTFPPHVDYEITCLGSELCAQLQALQAWMLAHGVSMPAGEDRCDERPRSRG